MLYRPAIFKDADLVAVQSGRYFPESGRIEISGDRKLFLEELKIPLDRLAYTKQVHENKVLVANEPGYHEGYDAIVTDRPDVFVCVSVADCTPVLIHDPVHHAVAAIHAGWRGTAAQIVKETIKTMEQKYGTQGKDCLAWIGACISERNFEVGEEVAQHFSPEEKRYDVIRQKFFVDLKQANKSQLLQCGLKAENIEISSYCTVADNDKFYSYRKEKGATGRMFALIGRR